MLYLNNSRIFDQINFRISKSKTIGRYLSSFMFYRIDIKLFIFKYEMRQLQRDLNIRNYKHKN